MILRSSTVAMMMFHLLSLLLLMMISISSSHGFYIHQNLMKAPSKFIRQPLVVVVVAAASRYGPPMSSPSMDDDDQRLVGNDDNGYAKSSSMNTLDDDDIMEQESVRVAAQQQEQKRVAEFRTLVELVMITQPEHLPSLLTKHMNLLLTIMEDGIGFTRVVRNILDETKSEIDQERIEQAMDCIVSFVEEFADQAKSLDDKNKKLLGKILRVMTDNSSSSTTITTKSSRDREELLDELLQQEKDNFSIGFLRHLDGECERIASSPQLTPQSSRMLEILRMIQTRVLEEIGKDLGEGALVLGQLIGYDDRQERLAVLDAGLTVRGVDFANELVSLTEEALLGFHKVGGGGGDVVDPDLVDCIQEIDHHLRLYLRDHNEFQ